MNETDLKYLIEATLLAAGRPVPLTQLQALFEERERPTTEQMQQALEALAADYAERGIEVVEVSSGWRIQVRARCVDMVSRLWQERPARYSRALLETLALIAYRQPITRSEIEEIRGVSISSTIMRAMQERNWIRVVGHREVPGRPELLGTTREFLDYFGLRSLDQLPTLAELKDVETIGVQLELPGGELPATAAAAETVAGSDEPRDPAATPGVDTAMASVDSTATSNVDPTATSSVDSTATSNVDATAMASEDADEAGDNDGEDSDEGAADTTSILVASDEGSRPEVRDPECSE